jgi:cardiolipin synthase (CMP-forming)
MDAAAPKVPPAPRANASTRPRARELLRLPNLLSLSRIAMAAVVWVAPRDVAFLLGVVVAAAITDLLDGWTARKLAHRRNEPFDPTGMGAWLDPLCDKVFVVSAVIAVVVAWDPRPSVMALVLLRDVLQVPLLAAFLLFWGARVRLDYRAALAGKLTTVLQFAALLSILVLPRATWPLAIACAVLGVVAVLVLVERALDAAWSQGVRRGRTRFLLPSILRRQPR